MGISIKKLLVTEAALVWFAGGVILVSKGIAYIMRAASSHPHWAAGAAPLHPLQTPPEPAAKPLVEATA